MVYLSSQRFCELIRKECSQKEMHHHQDDGYYNCRKSWHWHHSVDSKYQDEYWYEMVSRTSWRWHVRREEYCRRKCENDEKWECKRKRMLLEYGKLANQKDDQKDSQGGDGDWHLCRCGDHILKKKLERTR